MDDILTIVNHFRQSKDFALWVPVLRSAFLLVMGVACCVGAMALTAEDALAALRRSVRRAGLSDKEAAAKMGICQGLYSLKVNGGRPMTFEAFMTLPTEALQWFAVELASLVGVPSVIKVGAQLNQTIVSDSSHSHKEGAR